MRPPAPEQGGVARDKLRAEYALSTAPIPGIEMIVYKNTTTLVVWMGRSVSFLVPTTLFPQCS